MGYVNLATGNDEQVLFAKLEPLMGAKLSSEMREKDKVCCLMTVCAGDNPSYFEDAMLSILSQPELAVVYLGVDGPICRELESVIAKHGDPEKVKVKRNDSNRGLAYTLNKLIDEAIESEEVDFFARMDSDDISEVDRFSTQVAFLKANPEVSILGSQAKKIDDHGHVFGEIRRSPNHDSLIQNFIWRSPVLHPTVVIRRNVLDSGWRYNPEYRSGQDYELWVRMASKGYKFGNVPQSLLRFRTGSDFYHKRNWTRLSKDLRLRFKAMRTLRDYRLSNWAALGALIILRSFPRINAILK